VMSPYIQAKQIEDGYMPTDGMCVAEWEIDYRVCIDTRSESGRN
jgi:hypothetical protein